MKKEKTLKDEQGNDIVSPHFSDNPSEEGEVKVRLTPPLQHHELNRSAENSHDSLLSRMMEERSLPPGKDRKRTTKRTRKNRELLKRTRRATNRIPKPEKKRSLYFPSEGVAGIMN